jgi:hypothetical protein
MAFSKSKGPTKAQLNPFGGKRKKAPTFDIPGDRNFGSMKPGMATAAMKGTSMPPMRTPKGTGPARKAQGKQFKKAGGKKVF